MAEEIRDKMRKLVKEKLGLTGISEKLLAFQQALMDVTFSVSSTRTKEEIKEIINQDILDAVKNILTTK